MYCQACYQAQPKLIFKNIIKRADSVIKLCFAAWLNSLQPLRVKNDTELTDGILK